MILSPVFGENLFGERDFSPFDSYCKDVKNISWYQKQMFWKESVVKMH